MGLRLVYGRAGTGKSQFCFKEISEKINNKEKIYVITPEQFSFTSEKKLLDTIKTKAVINAEVLTFERMAYRVINEVGGITRINLSDLGKSMLFYDILDSNKKNLQFLGNGEQNVDLVETTIAEFKKHGVRQENLEKVVNQEEDNYLKAKLEDMNILYKSFEDRIQNKYIDENDLLTMLNMQIKKCDMFKNTIIYIDEFAGFTTQEYKIIEQLLSIAKEVTITVCSDDITNSNKPDSDIFYSNKQTVSKLISIAKDNGLLIEKSVFLEDTHRFKSKELKHLEKNIYDMPYNIYKDEIQDIKLFLASNPYSELEYVANQITMLVRNEKYRYRDIGIITKNKDLYSGLAKAIFAKYEIPVFIDEKRQLSQNILVQFILSVLEVFSRNWSYEAVFNYIKIGFCDIEVDDYFILENYCNKWGIKQSKWYKSDWEFENENNEYINIIRKKVVNPLLEFKSKLSRTKTVEDITRAIYEFLVENNINEKLQKKIIMLEEIGEFDIASEYTSSYNIVMDLFDEMVLILGNQKVKFDKYIKILKTGLNHTGLGKIPQLADQVILGDVDRSRSHKVKAIFVIGLNDGMFPSIHKDEGFFNDKDRDSLEKRGINLAKGTTNKLYEDNFNIYKALTTSEEKIYLSYPSSDEEGKSLRPSVLISKIKKIFPSIIEKSDVINKEEIIKAKAVTFDELLKNIRDYQDGVEISKIWFEIFNIYKEDEEWKYKLERALAGLKHHNIPSKLSKENVDRMYGTVLKTSISKLEKYKSCAFSFYLKYGLRIKDKGEFKVQSINTGSLMHEIIDEFFNVINNNDIKIKELTSNQIENIVGEIVDEQLKLKKNYIFTSTAKYRILVNRLKKLIIRAINYIIQTLVQSEFELLGNEIEFKDGKHYPAIKLELEDGKTVEITGKIDRIDVAKTKDGNYIRIIDYKSSVKNIDLNEVLAGLQIQLLTYLDATCKIEDVIPAGVLYFNLIDPMIKSVKPMSDEEIEEKLKKEFKMQGLILADVKIAKMMDKTLEKGASDIVPAYIDASGNLSKTRSSAVTKEEFENLQKHITKTIREISKEIFSGNIDLNPYYNSKKKKTPCDFCEYKSICQFDVGNGKNEYKYIDNLSKEEILEKIKEI